MPGHRFEIQIHERESVLIINVANHIDGTNAEEFQLRLEQSVKDYKGDAVILDLETLAYISSAGLRAILLIAKMVHTRGIAFSICSLSETTSSLIKTAGFEKVINVYESLSEAVSAVTN